VEKSLQLVLPKKKAALAKEEQDQEEIQDEKKESFVKKGTIIAMDRNTHKADVVATPRSSGYKEARKSAYMQSNSRNNSQISSNPPAKNKKFFGVALEESIRDCSNTNTPHIADLLMAHLFEKGTEVEGIFGISGHLEKIKELKQLFENLTPEQPAVDLDKYRVLDIASLLKIYFRELPECVLTAALYPSFIVAEQLDDVASRKSMIKSLIELIPDENKRLVQKLVVLLAITSANSAKNGMTVDRLSRSFASNILFPTVQQESLAKDLQSKIKITHLLIEEHEFFFP